MEVCFGIFVLFLVMWGLLLFSVTKNLKRNKRVLALEKQYSSKALKGGRYIIGHPDISEVHNVYLFLGKSAVIIVDAEEYNELGTITNASIRMVHDFTDVEMGEFVESEYPLKNGQYGYISDGNKRKYWYIVMRWVSGRNEYHTVLEFRNAVSRNAVTKTLHATAKSQRSMQAMS